MSRDAIRADALTDDIYVMDRGVLHLVTFVQTVGGNTLLVFANNWTVALRNDVLVEQATQAEVDAAERLARKTGRGLKNFPDLSDSDVAVLGTIDAAFGPMYADGEDPRGLLGEPCAKCGTVALLSPVELCVQCGMESALEAVDEMRGLPYGFAVSDGHRPKVSDDAMQHDGRYDNGRAEA